MDTVIGLGSVGCDIASIFEKYPQYDVYKIHTDIDGDNCFEITEQNNPEAYESNCPDLSSFLGHIAGDVLFVVAGGSKISGASLKILQRIKDCNINVLYIKPDESDLTRTGILQDRLTYNVFQQYARSGLFKRLYLASTKDIENIIGDISIIDRDTKINEFIVTLIHYINVFQNTDPIIDNFEAPKDNSRISTFGVYDMDTDDEQALFSLQHTSDKCYYFAINETALKTDGKLLKKIKEHVALNKINTSYQVHSTKHAKSFCYFVSHTNIIQGLDRTED